MGIKRFSPYFIVLSKCNLTDIVIHNDKVKHITKENSGLVGNFIEDITGIDNKQSNISFKDIKIDYRDLLQKIDIYFEEIDLNDNNINIKDNSFFIILLFEKIQN